MSKPREPQYCWQFWSCVKAVREKCTIYQKNYGKRCWLLSGCAAMVERKFKNCWECPWYIETSFAEAEGRV
ncbi:MAG: hypothetical protein WC357_04450 [Candidatus Omnitrophota bacterium]